MEVKQTAITVISGDKLWESPRRSFTGPGPVRAEITASWLFLPLIVSQKKTKHLFKGLFKAKDPVPAQNKCQGLSIVQVWNQRGNNRLPWIFEKFWLIKKKTGVEK